MADQFTPGPWEYDLHTVVGPGGAIAETCTSDFDDEMMLANAKLCAAAPMLLDACRYVLRWWKECGFGEADDPWHPSIVEKLQQSIQAATGERLAVAEDGE